MCPARGYMLSVLGSLARFDVRVAFLALGRSLVRNSRVHQSPVFLIFFFAAVPTITRLCGAYCPLHFSLYQFFSKTRFD